MGKKKQKQARPIVTDVSAVKNAAGEYVVSRSYAEVVDLLSEGVIDGLVSGEYSHVGDFDKVRENEAVTGYTSVSFEHYTATGDAGTSLNSLGFLRSVYWNEIPVVDKDGFYNFPYINLQKVDGLPEGTIPKLNSDMDTYAGVSSSDVLDLTINRSIGERLYGTEVEGGDSAPTDVKQAQLKSGIKIDKYAKTYTVLNKEIQKILVNIKIAGLFENVQAGPKTYKKSKHLNKCNRASTGFGDTKARTIEYNIYYRPIYDQRFIPSSSAGAEKPAVEVDWSSPIKERVTGKVDQPYIRATTIDLSQFDYSDQEGFEGWEIRIVRITPEPVTSYYRATSFVDSLVEVYGTKLKYPYSSMVYSQFDARSFSRVPTRAYDTNLIKVKIPNNYNPFLKTYGKSSAAVGTMQGDDGSKISDGDRTNSTCNGVNSWSKRTVIDPEWDGGFATIDGSVNAQPVKVWTDNPAWCFYDLMTNPRYGLGDHIDEAQIDKWALYEIAQHCDELVQDTYGGLEPRFTMNYLITSREEAFKVLNDLTSIFRGIAYFSNGSIFAVQDKYKLPVYQFNNSNVAGGNFTYSSSAKKARHSVAIVRYNDKRNFFQPAIEYLEDEESVRRYGIKEIETSALGATSRGQARRFAKWILQSEALETETVSFSMGQDGAYVQPGDVIQIYDNYRSPLKYSGRTNAVIKGIPAITNEYNPSTQNVATQRNNPYSDKSNFNTVILDQALGFHPDKVYKFSILTPTYNTVTGDSNEEVRRSQIQTGLFRGSDTQLTTGNHQNNLRFRSDLSGQCTQITFNTGNNYGGVENSFDFDNYVITGYTNTGVWTSGPLQNMGVSEQEYSGGCFSGENLVWSVEPDNADDPEFISGSYSNYKIINVKEDEDVYSISALAYSTGKYDEVDASTAVSVASKISFPLFPTGITASNSTSIDSEDTAIGPILSITQDEAFQGANKNIVYGTIAVEFSVAGYELGEQSQKEDVKSFYVKDSNQESLDITYAVAILTNNDTSVMGTDTPGTNEIKIIKPNRYPIYTPYIAENIANQRILGTDSEGKDIINKRRLVTADIQDSSSRSKIHGEYLISRGINDYYVAVFALSETSTVSWGMVRKLSLSSTDGVIDSDIGTVSLTNLTSEGLDFVQTSPNLLPLDSVEPGFTWNISAEDIYSTQSSADKPYFQIPIDNSDRQYRITFREPHPLNELKSNFNQPSDYIYLEITGYNTQGDLPNFVFQKFYNDPNQITGYRDDPHVTGWTNGIVTDKDEADWLSVSGSGFNIRNNTEQFPVRQFDIVIEAQDSNGNTSAGNKIWENTILGTSASTEVDSFDTSKSNYEIFGGKIESPSGVFFAQTTGTNPKGLGLNYQFIRPEDAFKLEYPYVASAFIYPNGYLEIKLNNSTNANGENISKEDEIDVFFNNTAGILFYYTTGDNTQEYKNNTPTALNKAPEFTIDTSKLNETNNKGLQSLVTPATYDAEGKVVNDAAAFGGLVNLEGYTGLAVNGGAVLPQVHRGFYLFNESDSLDSIRIPFPNISRPEVENINLSFAYFDDLHLLSAFEEDGDTPILLDKGGVDTAKIFSEDNLNYSSSATEKAPSFFTSREITYPNTMVEAPVNSLFLNENSINSAGDSALAFRGWVEVTVDLNLFKPERKEGELIFGPNDWESKSWQLENTPADANIEEGFIRKVVSKNLTSLTIVRAYDADRKKYYLYFNVAGLASIDSSKTAVMISENKGAPEESGEISYGWEGQNEDVLQIKVPYGNAAPAGGGAAYYKKITFGILRTNE
jgi:hypothetical protein